MLRLSLLAALAFYAGALGVSAQQEGKENLPEPAKVEVKSLVIQANITKTLGMSRPKDATEDPIIKTVHNENPRVVKVQSIIDDPRHVLVTGVAPGMSRITFKSAEGKEEAFDVRVPSDDEPLREQQRADFLAAVKKAVPASNVEAVVAPNNTVILSGWLLGPEQTQVVMALARSIWGAQANIVDTMRIGHVPQVQVECTMVVVNRSKVRTAAFNWVTNRQNYFVGSLLSTQQFTNSIVNAVSGTPAANLAATSTPANLTFGIIKDKFSFSGFVEALRTEGMAKIHSEPKIVTLSGKPAQFVSGGETPILTSTGIGSPTVSYKSFGTTVDVLPVVLGDGRINLEVAPALSSRNDGNGIVLPGGSGTVVPGFDTRGVRVSVQMMDGETVAIGGLIQFTINGSVTKVPVIGDLPILGACFSQKSYDEREEELVILLTPRVIDPMACSQLPARLPSKLTRTPDDFELFLEQLLELPRGQRQVCPDGRCYQAGYKNGPTASSYPCGDSTNRFCGPKGCTTADSYGTPGTMSGATGSSAATAGSNAPLATGGPANRVSDARTGSGITPVGLPAAPPLHMDDQSAPAPALRLPGPGPSELPPARD
jgi:pilus assembly protein CpaC